MEPESGQQIPMLEAYAAPIAKVTGFRFITVDLESTMGSASKIAVAYAAPKRQPDR